AQVALQRNEIGVRGIRPGRLAMIDARPGRLVLLTALHFDAHDALLEVQAELGRRLFALAAGQAREVALDQRLERRLVDPTHEDEIEVAHVAEAIAVERERALELDALDGLERGRRAA